MDAGERPDDRDGQHPGERRRSTARRYGWSDRFEQHPETSPAANGRGHDDAAVFVSGELPASWALAMRELNYLNLEDQRVGGSLPAEWSALGALSMLNLARNQLEGPLPGSWGGSATHWPGGTGDRGLESLAVLDLSGNTLTGPLPPQWSKRGVGGLNALYLADLSNNHLSGTLPHGWGNLPALFSLDLGEEGAVLFCGRFWICICLPARWATSARSRWALA